MCAEGLRKPSLEWSGLPWRIQTKERGFFCFCFSLNILKIDITCTKLKYSRCRKVYPEK